MTKQEAVDNGLILGHIVEFQGSWGSGLATLVVSTEEGVRHFYADNGALVRTLDSIFGGVIGANHTVNQSAIRDQCIALAVDGLRLIEGLMPVD